MGIGKLSGDDVKDAVEVVVEKNRNRKGKEIRIHTCYSDYLISFTEIKIKLQLHEL